MLILVTGVRSSVSSLIYTNKQRQVIQNKRNENGFTYKYNFEDEVCDSTGGCYTAEQIDNFEYSSRSSLLGFVLLFTIGMAGLTFAWKKRNKYLPFILAFLPICIAPIIIIFDIISV